MLKDSSLQDLIISALEEDRALQDITSDIALDGSPMVEFEINSRENIIFCGKKIIDFTFEILKQYEKFSDSKLELKTLVQDGDFVKKGGRIAHGVGNAKLIFAAERVLLNILQHLSGVATKTKKFIQKLNNKSIHIVDTRKTLPNLRILQKYAVRVAGGENHRANLEDMILIKDNHIAAMGSISQIMERVQQLNEKNLKIEIECENFSQVKEAISFNPDAIMLDNMQIEDIIKSSDLIRAYNAKRIFIEVSGGVNLSNIHLYSKLNIDFISIGSLTHSTSSVDIGLDVINYDA